MIRTSCPHCQKSYAFQSEFSGRVARCQSCGGEFPLPHESLPDLETAEIQAETLEDAGNAAYAPIPDWVQKPAFPIEARG
jgi:hypothetical protein